MSPQTRNASYVLGDTGSEHERLIRQAAIFEPFTERLFRDAGIGSGQRVLDVGSGVGDVAMLAAKVVGSTGEVVGVERDATTLARARSRVAEAGLSNLSFAESDIGDITSDKPFDAVVGRFIIEFLPDPVAVVRSLSALIRPGGLMVFQDASWGPFLQLTARLPLRGKCASLIYDFSNARGHTWTWTSSSTGRSSKQVYQRRKCGSRFRSATSQRSCNGSTTYFALCARICRKTTSPQAVSEILRRSN